MTSTEIQTQTHDADLIPTPDVTDDGLALLQRQAEAMGAAHKIATVLSGTGMVPQAYRGKPDDAAAAILYGAEVGLKPQQALQQVFVVHGQPSIYARTMVALLKAKGYRFETIESTDQGVTVRGTSPRGEVEESTWTVDRAKTAGYTSNKKYATDPQAMLYAKAASEVSRKLAPDVLLGIKYAAEDLELEQSQPVRATAERTDRRGGQSALERAKKKPVPEEKPDPSQQALEGIGRCQDADQLDQMLNWATNQGMSEAQLDALKDAAAARADELGLVAGEEQA